MVTRILIVLLVAGSLCPAANGLSCTTMINNGASSKRVDMIFVGDGYALGEINTTCGSHIQAAPNHFFNTPPGSPLGRGNKFFNVHRVNLISNQSRADKPQLGVFVDIALDASDWWGGTDRCLYFNSTKANPAVATSRAGSGIDTSEGMLLRTVNDSRSGGCGGQWGVHAGANQIAIHEIGWTDEQKPQT